MACPVCIHEHSSNCNYDWYMKEAERLHAQAREWEKAAEKCVVKGKKHDVYSESAAEGIVFLRR